MRTSNYEHNKGLTLVELVVAVAVLAIAMTGIIGMINLSAKYYSSSNKEVELQDEVQKTFSVVSSIVTGAKSVKKDTPSSGAYLVEQSSRKYLIVKKNDGIYICKYSATTTINASTVGNCAKEPNLLVDHVSSFDIDTSTSDKGYVKITIQITYGSRIADMSKFIYLRNTSEDYIDIYSKCDITREDDKKTFQITQNTGSKIEKNKVLTIKMHISANIQLTETDLGLSGDVVLQSVAYDASTGTAVFKAKLKDEWANSNPISVVLSVNKSSLTLGNDTYIIGLGK